MDVKLEWKMLIVEDDDHIYPSMERCLNTHATRSDINLRLIRARTLYEARTNFKAYQPEVVSIDMGFPIREKEHPDAEAGARFAQIVRRASSVPVVMYSGSEVHETYNRLKHFGFGFGNVAFPEVLKKNWSHGHDAWAKKLLELLLVRPA